MDDLERRLAAAMRADLPVAEEGFSDRVMVSLPRRRFAGARARRWTLAMAAAAGALFTATLGEPLEQMLQAVSPWDAAGTWIVAALAASLVALPTAWAFWSARDD